MKKFGTKFHEWYLKQFNAKLKVKNGQDLIGPELEFPVVDGSYYPADVRAIFPRLKEMGWKEVSEADSSVIGMKHPHKELIVKMDATPAMLEVNFPPSPMKAVGEEVAQIMEELSLMFSEVGCHILAMGAFPYNSGRREDWLSDNPRYSKGLIQAFPQLSNRPSIDEATRFASFQVHLDIPKMDEIVDGMNVLNFFAPCVLALNCWSFLYDGSAQKIESGRENFWKFTDQPRTGIPPKKFENIEEYLNFMMDIPFAFTEDEDGRYILPKTTFRQFMKDVGEESYLRHWLLHEGCVWHDARIRLKFGTFECRGCDTSTPENAKYFFALQYGLLRNLRAAKDEMEDFLKKNSWKKVMEIHEKVIFGFQKNDPQKKVFIALLADMVDLVSDGLDRIDLPESDLLIAVMSGRASRLEHDSVSKEFRSQSRDIEEYLSGKIVKKANTLDHLLVTTQRFA
ncbi:MAG: hypothetical protein HY453_01040 [Parcubacteria group bacterium]|nr:hypothetical protein [Parcubacteria group bacterium]